MAFHGLTFPNQNVSALDDGGFYRSFRSDGVIQGCGISFTNTSITIQAGWLIAGGRLVQIDGATTVEFDEIPTSGYGRLMLQIDTSQASTADEFAQITLPVDYSASVDGFSAPVQEDINIGSGTIYQVVIAIVQISGGNLTAIATGLGLSAIIVRRDGVPRVGMYAVESGGILYFYDANGENIGSLAKGSASLTLNNYNAGSVQLFDSGPLYLNGDTINIRPHNDAINQTIVNADGTWDFGAQIKGGHPLLRMPKAGTTSIPGGTNYTALTPALTGLDENGLYAYDFKCGYVPSSGSAHTPRLRVGDQYKSFYCGATTLTYLGIQGIITGVTSLQPALTTMASSVSGSVQGGAELRVFRIN